MLRTDFLLSSIHEDYDWAAIMNMYRNERFSAITFEDAPFDELRILGYDGAFQTFYYIIPSDRGFFHNSWLVKTDITQQILYEIKHDWVATHINKHKTPAPEH